MPVTLHRAMPQSAVNYIPPATADDARDSNGSDDDDEGEEVAGDGGDDGEE
ncbi:hypothetical protein DPSP01_013787 [Paraphaeosphaeria sporulosa]